MLAGDIPRLNARRFPNKVGIICEGRELTWSAVNDRANRIGSYLRNAGLQPGDRVAMFAPNTLEWPEISFGLSKAGFILVPLNVRLAPAELEYQVQDSGSKALIFHGSVAGAAATVLAGNNDVKIALEIDGEGSAPDYEQALLGASAGDPTPSDLKPDDLRAFIYTSGTTGLPKAVMHTHRTMLSGCIDQVVMDRSRHDDRYIAVTPFFTSGGAFRTLSWAYQGQTMVIMPKFEVPEVLATIEKYRITSTIMVPTMLQRVVSYLEERPKVDISSLTRIGYGSAPASAPLIESALELLGCDLWQRYGQSEVGGFVTMLSPEDHRKIALGDVARVNSCGREWMTMARNAHRAKLVKSPCVQRRLAQVIGIDLRKRQIVSVVTPCSLMTSLIGMKRATSSSLIARTISSLVVPSISIRQSSSELLHVTQVLSRSRYLACHIPNGGRVRTFLLLCVRNGMEIRNNLSRKLRNCVAKNLRATSSHADSPHTRISHSAAPARC